MKIRIHSIEKLKFREVVDAKISISMIVLQYRSITLAGGRFRVNSLESYSNPNPKFTPHIQGSSVSGGLVP